MIPEQIDALSLIRDLNSWGWKDSKIEIATGVSQSYIAKLKDGKVKRIGFVIGAKLYNFHSKEFERAQARAVELLERTAV